MTDQDNDHSTARSYLTELSLVCINQMAAGVFKAHEVREATKKIAALGYDVVALIQQQRADRDNAAYCHLVLKERSTYEDIASAVIRGTTERMITLASTINMAAMIEASYDHS